MWEVDQKCNGYALLAENRFIFFPTWKYRRIFLLGQQIGFLVTSNPDTSLRRTSHHSVSQNVPVQLISSRRADTFLTLLISLALGFGFTFLSLELPAFPGGVSGVCLVVPPR